jgi:hypothetical protein
MRPCDGNHAPIHAGPYTLDQCRVCWLYHNDPAYRALWENSEPSPRSLPCVFLGEVIDRLGCPCPARWRRGCAVHGECSLELCKACPDYQTE